MKYASFFILFFIITTACTIDKYINKAYNKSKENRMIKKIELILVGYGLILLTLLIFDIIEFELFAYLAFFGLVLDRALMRMGQTK